MTTDFQLPSTSLGLARLGPNPDPAGSNEVVRLLLTKNHEKFHMYFRDVAGHNHIPHAVLSTLAMGGTPKHLRRAYDDGTAIQRAMPPTADPSVIAKLSDPVEFSARMQILDEYPNFLAFFKSEIARHGGDWTAVVNEHVFCSAKKYEKTTMLAQMFEGLYHPLIHFGFGVEFALPGLVAEGLAQAASHDPMYIDEFFHRAEQRAAKGDLPRKPLVELYRMVREDETIRGAARLPDGPWKVRDGVLGRAMEEIVNVAAQFRVDATQEAVDRATAEMINCAAWTCGGVHKQGKARKIDFFLMHNVTSSLFLTVLCHQPWISMEDKVRLVEYKTRLDLVWYAASAAPEVVDENFLEYEPTVTKGWDWHRLYEALNEHHDDGHVAKFVRALKNGEEVCARYEGVVNGTNGTNGTNGVNGANGTNGQVNGHGGAADFPVKGESWLRIAQMCYDSTHMFVDGQKKWVWGAGFDPMWKAVADAN